MEKTIKAANKDETYYCSLRDVKNIFADTQAKVFFVSGESFHAYLYRIERYVKEKIIGAIVCAVTMNTRSAHPQIDFHAIKETQYSEELRQLFVDECLPQMYDFYQEHLNDQSQICREILMLIELLNGKFIIHKIATKRKPLNVSPV